MYTEGQALLGEIKFVDGEMPEYKRPYLIIEVDNINGKIKVLNVSSKKGKEQKLKFNTNYELKLYNPPFLYPSFVKLDSLTEITFLQANSMVVLNQGKTLDLNEIANIKQKLKSLNKTI